MKKKKTEKPQTMAKTGKTGGRYEKDSEYDACKKKKNTQKEDRGDRVK